MRSLLATATGALALLASSLTGAGTVNALHDGSHPVGMAAWEIDGVPLDGREDRLNATPGPVELPAVQHGDRVTHLIRVVDQSTDANIQLSFISPGHAYVLGSASGGMCAAPVEAAPGIFQQTCTVTIGDDGNGDLFVTYEITARSDQDCEDPSGEPAVATLILTEPQAWRSASDVRVCAGQSAAPRPTDTPASNLPDTATARGMSDAAGLSVMIGIAVVLMLVGSVLLPRPR